MWEWVGNCVPRLLGRVIILLVAAAAAAAFRLHTGHVRLDIFDFVADWASLP